MASSGLSAIASPAPTPSPTPPPAAAFHSPFQPLPTLTRSPSPTAAAAAAAQLGVPSGTAGARSRSHSQSTSQPGSGPPSAPSSTFTSPFASLSSSPRGPAGQTWSSGDAFAMTNGAAYGGHAVISAMGGSRSMPAEAGPTVALPVKSGFPAPTFSSGGGAAVGIAGFPPPFLPRSGAASPASGSLSGASGPSLPVSPFHTSHLMGASASVPQSQSASFPTTAMHSRAVSQGGSPLGSPRRRSPQRQPQGNEKEGAAPGQTDGAAAPPFSQMGSRPRGASAGSFVSAFPRPSSASGSSLSSFPSPPTSNSVSSSRSTLGFHLSPSVSPNVSSPPSPAPGSAALSRSMSSSLNLSVSPSDSAQPSPVPSPRSHAAGVPFSSAIGSAGGSSGSSVGSSPFPANLYSARTTHWQNSPMAGANAMQRKVHGRSASAASLSPAAAVAAAAAAAAAAEHSPYAGHSVQLSSAPRMRASVEMLPVTPRRMQIPDSLRASRCSILAQLLAPAYAPLPSLDLPAPPPAHASLPQHLQPFIVTGPKAASSPISIRINGESVRKAEAQPQEDAFTRLLSSLTFSLSSLLLESGSTAGLSAFDFSTPSPDDESRARIALAGAPTRSVHTDAPGGGGQELKKGKQQTQRRKSSGRAGSRELDEDEALPGTGGGFFHSTATVSRSAMGSSVTLSSASGGAGDGAAGEEGTGLRSSSFASTLDALSSRLFQQLSKAVQSQKRGVLDELSRAAQVAALLLQQRVIEPREREHASRPLDAPALVRQESSGSSSSGASAAAAAARASAEEPFSRTSLVYTAPAISTAAAAVAPAQVTALQTSLTAARLAAAERALSFAGSSMSSSVRSLYDRKVSAFSAGRSLNRSQSGLSSSSSADVALELRTPTADSSFLPALAEMRVLVVGGRGAGVSTLLGHLLYEQGRLPFALVKPRDAPTCYWEMFNGQQLQGGGQQGDLSDPSSSAALSSLPPAVASFIRAHPRLHELNCRRFDFSGYVHCAYTDRYRLRLLHSRTANVLPSAASQSAAEPAAPAASAPLSSKQSAAAAAASARATAAAAAAPPSAQQLHVDLLAALQADVILLVVDGSSGAILSLTPALLSQLLVAQQSGARSVVVCVTQLDSGSAPYSKQRFDSAVASVTSSLLKPLGFSPASIQAVPVSGRTGENVSQRSERGELHGWYAGPTLLQLLDRLPLPQSRQPEALAERRPTAVLMEKPTIVRSILNDEEVEALQCRVQMLAGTLLIGEPICSATAAHTQQEAEVRAALLSRTRAAPLQLLGPVHVAQMARGVPEDERDTAVYEDAEDEKGDAPATAVSSASSSSSAAAASSSSSSAASSASSPAPSALSKHKVSSDGRRLSHAERKAALAEEKREHARRAAKEKSAQAWKEESKIWERREAELQAEMEAEAEEQAAREAAAAAAATPAASASLSASSASAASNLTLSFIPSASPCLVEGDIGLLTLRCLPASSALSDDSLHVVLHGRSQSDALVAHSTLALQQAAASLGKGDLLLGSVQEAANVRRVTAFRAEVLALSYWTEGQVLQAGKDVSLVQIGDALPSPAAVLHDSPESLLSLLCSAPSRSAAALPPPSRFPARVDRLVSVLNKSNRTGAPARRKLDALHGAPALGAGEAVTLACAPELSVLELSCAPTLLLDTLASGGRSLGRFLVVLEERVIAMAVVTQILKHEG